MLDDEFDRIVNDTPWIVGLLRHQTTSARASLVVIVKRTLTWSGGTLRESSRQLDLFRGDVPWPDGPQSTVRFESDMVPFKPRGDIVLAGHAYAPDGRPVETLEASLRVNRQRYRLRVFGDRRWRRRASGLAAVSTPTPFLAMELRYERAFGGIDGGEYCAGNPVGRGFVATACRDSPDGRLLPNIEDPHDPVVDPRSRPKPVGFAFFGRSWQPRLGLSGTVDESFRRSASASLPMGFSYDVFNGAHPNLQVPGWLRGDEEIELVHLVPEGFALVRLDGALPSIEVVRHRVAYAGSAPATVVTESEVLTMRLDTLVLVPEHESLYEVFRGAVILEAIDSLEIARIHVRHA